MHNSDDRAVNWHSKSFKIINFCCNRKAIYDFLLVINCHLSSILHCFRDIASQSQKLPHPSLSPQSCGLSSNVVVKFGRQRVKALGYILVKLHDPSFSRFVTIHSRHRWQTNSRQTTSYGNSGTCNAVATFQKNYKWAAEKRINTNRGLHSKIRAVDDFTPVGIWYLSWYCLITSPCAMQYLFPDPLKQARSS